MEEIMKSWAHKRDGNGNVVLEHHEEFFFDYIQGNNDLTWLAESHILENGKTTLRLK